VLFARRRDALEAAARAVEAVRKAATQRVVWRQLDAADRLQVEQVMAEAVAAFGAPDVLVNCAGRAYPHRFEDVTYAQFDDTLRMNVHTCWNTVQVLLPQMRERGGYIVNTSSVAGLIGVFGYTDYCASKFAIVGFSEALRSELKPLGITVSVLCPPDTDTPGFAIENRTKPEETRAISATAKVMSAEAVADALIDGMRCERLLIIPGRDSRLVALAKRFFPGLLERVLDRTVRQVAARRH
jgi:3-dehydrosphinganine reductase